MHFHPGPLEVAFTIRGPITRADLPGLCDRVCALLPGSGQVVVCDVAGVEPDAVTVDALARLQLAAQRRGCGVSLCGASGQLLDVVELMGLTHVLPWHDERFAPRASCNPRRVQRTVLVNGVRLCSETFGDPGAPTILLIAGSTQSMDWWWDELCARLADGGRRVIRYDLRDTGQSVAYPPGRPGYDGADLVDDAIGLLDALGVPRAHVVGMSMGGGIAQRLTLDHRARVASLTLVSTSPATSYAGQSQLPGVAPALARHLAAPPPGPDWSDRHAVVEYVLEDLGHYAGSVRSDEEQLRRLVETVVDRTVYVASSWSNHFALAEPKSRGQLGDIDTPTLVLHGTEDPLFPLPHGQALAAAIPGARLVPLDGVGHEIPPSQTWDEVVPQLLGHTEGR